MQGDRTPRSAEQEIGTNADANANRATCPHVGAGKRAAPSITVAVFLL